MRISDWSSDVCSSDLPLETVARVYDELGLALTAQARGAMARHLETDHHASAPKRAYTLAEYGLDAAAIEAAFAPYIDRFSLAREKNSAERRSGKECGRTCSSRCAPDH